jgi:hypothetical protein
MRNEENKTNLEQNSIKKMWFERATNKWICIKNSENAFDISIKSHITEFIFHAYFFVIKSWVHSNDDGTFSLDEGRIKNL